MRCGGTRLKELGIPATSNFAKNTRPILFLTVTGLVSATVIVLLRTMVSMLTLPNAIGVELVMGFPETVYGFAMALYFVSMEGIPSVLNERRRGLGEKRVLAGRIVRAHPSQNANARRMGHPQVFMRRKNEKKKK
jgi:hypothetical protein